MKLKMEFEADDVLEMLVQHFERNGFRIRNLDNLVQRFLEAYPEGLIVEVDTLPQAPKEPLPSVSETPPLSVVRDTPAEITKVTAPDVRLSASDLFDPSHHGNIKEANLDDATQLEIAHILKSSRDIERNRS